MIAKLGIPSGLAGAKKPLVVRIGESMTVASFAQPIDLARMDRMKRDTMTPAALDEALIEQLIRDRIDARRAHDFAKADSIRKTLDGMGLIIIDGKDEVTGELWTEWDVRSDTEESP